MEMQMLYPGWTGVTNDICHRRGREECQGLTVLLECSYHSFCSYLIIVISLLILVIHDCIA